MAYDEELVQRVRSALKRRENIDEKKMFGGVGFLLHGNMCVGVWREWLIVRLGPERAEWALGQDHVRPFDITGKKMKGWAMIDPAGVEHDSDLRAWIRASLDFVSGLPKK